MSQIVVIGGGVLGCAVAMEMAGRDADVLLVERNEPGVGATGASAGMLAPQYETAGESPFFRLAVESRAAYSSFVERVERLADWRVGYRMNGMLVANRTDTEAAKAEELVAWQRRIGLPARVVDAREARQIHPGLAPDVPSWLWLPEEAQVDAQRLATALGEAVRNAGARLRLGAGVEAVLSEGGRATGVRLEGGETVEARAVVLAAGAWSSRLEGLPRELPVRPVRGQILRVKPPELPGWALVADHHAHYLVPRENGTVLVGSTMEEVGYDDSTTEAGEEALAGAASALIPALGDAPVVEKWAGLRPISADGWPILGPDPDLEGLFYATGHGRNGILLAPLSGRIVSELVLDGQSVVRWEAFGVERLG